jgi:hypothetical protein
MKNLQTQENIK